MSSPLSDEILRKTVEVWRDNDCNSKRSADAMGVNYETFKSRLVRAKANGFDLSEGARNSVTLAGLSYGESLGGHRRIYDENGRQIDTIRWAKPRVEEDPTQWIEIIKEALADAPLAVSFEQPSGPSDLCALFPVADLHVGLLTDQEEVGEDWSSKRSHRVFSEIFARLVDVTPSAETAILGQLGDLMHVDDQRNVTPQSGHQLDADTRYFMILRRAVAVMRFAVDELRKKYPRVVYRGCRGNHDMTAHHAVTLALAEHYRETPGVEIVQSAGEFYVHEFGKNMTLLHHGDRAKPERLVQFAAAEWPEIWGRTKHRMAISGHVHHETVKELGGMRFESVGTIIPRDFNAFSKAYSARRGLVSITLDRDQGEVSRARIGL